LHIGPVELLRNIDVVVASTNVYFELSHTFATSLSAALRSAAATRAEENGHIVDDVIGRELTEELARSGHRGLAAAPGSVRVTHSGALQRQGIYRVFHAAVATPRRGSQRYEVAPGTIPAAIRNVFRRAAVERGSSLPQLRSICFPLFGAGCGAIDRQQSLHWMLAGLAQELPADAPWEIHLLSRTGGSLDLSDWTQVGGLVD
jgi:O-acetyl-ADP-ribose deacetylase (regulator of RNase III)